MMRPFSEKFNAEPNSCCRLSACLVLEVVRNRYQLNESREHTDVTFIFLYKFYLRDVGLIKSEKTSPKIVSIALLNLANT